MFNFKNQNSRLRQHPIVVSHSMDTPKLFLLLLIFVSVSVAGQVPKEYKRIILDNKINKKVTIKNKESESDITFLGVVNTDNGTKKYYVLKEFTAVRAASTWHGHSSVYFVDTKFQKSIRYDLAMPENLPYKLSHDKLLFNYKDCSLTKEYSQDLKLKLPSHICVAPLDCYPRED
jgi:hypothetical protein